MAKGLTHMSFNYVTIIQNRTIFFFFYCKLTEKKKAGIIRECAHPHQLHSGMLSAVRPDKRGGRGKGGVREASLSSSINSHYLKWSI